MTSHCWLWCAAAAGVVSDTTRRYLVTQRAVLPTSCCYLTTTALSPLYNYLFIFKCVSAGSAATVVCLAFLLDCGAYVYARGNRPAGWVPHKLCHTEA